MWWCFLLKRLLVVDDDEDSRDTLSDILEFKGFTVVGKAVNGYDAVQQYFKHIPDVVLLDLMMIGCDGFYALEHIRNVNSDAKIIVLSADQTEETRMKLKKMSQDMVLAKPFDIDQLIQLINS